MKDQNPFAHLDPRLFPSKNTGRSQKETRKEMKKEAARAISEEGISEDTALFLKAMGNIQKTKPAKGAGPDGPDEPTMADALAQSLGNIQPAAKPKGSASAGKLPPPVRVEEEITMEAAGFTADPQLAKINKEKKRIHTGAGSHTGDKETAARNHRLENLAALTGLHGETGEVSLYPEDDIAFFSAIQTMGDVTPLAGKGRDIPPVVLPGKNKPPVPSDPLKDFMEGKVEFSLSGTEEFMEGHVVGLDLLTVGKLQARQYSPEAHIDLHGLNAEQAYQTLTGFFKNAYHKGLRTVLVVTGRGLNSPNNTPVLRTKLGEWLTHEPFKRVILAFCTAAPEDGGTGAIYVLLRKYRKNSGKIHWDTMPTDAEFFL